MRLQPILLLPVLVVRVVSIPYSHTPILPYSHTPILAVFSFQGHSNSNGLSVEGSFTPDSKYIMSGERNLSGDYR